MEVQAALGSDIALVFDECTPFNVTRDYTARSTERTPPLARPLPRLARRARPGRPARLRDRPGRRGGGPAARVGAGGRRARPRRDRDRRLARRGQAADVRGRRAGRSTSCRRSGPRHLLGIGDVDDLLRGVELGHRHVRLRDADPHRPPRHGGRARPGARAGASTSPRAATATPTSRSSRAARARPARAATRAPTCTTCSRRARRPPRASSRIHNLAYLQLLMAALRDAIDGRPARRGDGGAARAAPRRGDAPRSAAR